MESDAIRYVSNRRPDLDLLKAPGQSYGDAEAQLLALRELQGNVPAPLIDQLPGGNELRTHTRYGVNDVTGEREVRPFIDTETGEALATEFGMLDLHPMTKGGPDETASESVGINAVKLMDEGETLFNDGPSHYADVIRDGVKTDLMMVGRGGDFNDTMNIPRYTSLLAKPGVNIGSRVRELKSRKGLTTAEAVENLARLGEILQTNSRSQGKLNRAFVENVDGDNRAVYDELVVSGYPRRILSEAAAVKAGYGRGGESELSKRFATDRLALAPETLHRVDLPGLSNAIDRGEVETKQFSNRNRGVRGTGYVRDKLQEIIPQDNNPYVTDLTVTHPHTQQILRHLPYV